MAEKDLSLKAALFTLGYALGKQEDSPEDSDDASAFAGMEVVCLDD